MEEDSQQVTYIIGERVKHATKQVVEMTAIAVMGFEVNAVGCIQCKTLTAVGKDLHDAVSKTGPTKVMCRECAAARLLGDNNNIFAMLGRETV